MHSRKTLIRSGRIVLLYLLVLLTGLGGQSTRPAAAVTLDSHGRLVRNGTPVFLRGWYSDGDVGRLRRLAAGGFNAVLDYGMTARPVEVTRAYLDEAERLGVAVILCVNDVYPSATYREMLGDWRGNAAILDGVVRAFRDHPAVIAWYQNDELPPDKKDEIALYSHRIRELDPRHPQFMVHEHPAAMAAFLGSADLFGIDHYPIPQHGPEAFGRVFNEARAVTGSRPLWAVLQDFAWYQHKPFDKPLIAGDPATERARLPSAAEWRDGRPPTEAEVRAMTYLALVNGAQGVLYWCLYNLDFLPDRAERWAAACRLGAELAELAPVLLEPAESPTVWSDRRVHGRALIHEGRRYLIAVNESSEPVRAEAAWQGSKASVLFEDRSVGIRANTLTDFFAPLARHVYVALDGADEPQVHWRRTLEEAEAAATAESRPLLIAVNMDGESASDRITREIYRDPEFVDASRKCVCLIASPYRHNQRDFDDLGRRIPCPRLGIVTCGEHLALEPEVYDRFLSDAERVAPRHALIAAGRKSWDLYLNFDLEDVKKRLIESVRALPPRASAPQSTSLTAADALRIRLTAWESATGSEREALRRDIGSTGMESFAAQVVRGMVSGYSRPPGTMLPDGREKLLSALIGFDRRTPDTRRLLISARALAGCEEALAPLIADVHGRTTADAVQEAIVSHGGTFSLKRALDAAREVARGTGPFPKPGRISDSMPDSATLERQVGELKIEAATAHAGAEVLARYGKACLDLGRRRVEAKAGGAEELFASAERVFGDALLREPGHADWWIERARAAYFAEHFDDEYQFARKAFELFRQRPGPMLPAIDAVEEDRAAAARGVMDNADAVEALRWIGDACARSLASRAGTDPPGDLARILDGARALALVAASPYSDASDWIACASFFEVLGFWQEQELILREGARRLPLATDLREALNRLYWSWGRVELVPRMADELAAANPTSHLASWYAGYAWMIAAEDARNREAADAAIGAYQNAIARFTEAQRLGGYDATSKRFVALSWMGTGMVQVREGRRAEAADCLVNAGTTDPGVVQGRDGLGCDIQDLVDRIFEWRSTGPSPVDPALILDRLERANPKNPVWALAVADSELREALRSDGRNPEKIERQTVDAAGKPIRMAMGLPTGLGDVQLRASIAAARRAHALGETDETRHTLAQSLTIWAERMLERNRPDDAREELGSAASLMSVPFPEGRAGRKDLEETAARLRTRLGDARPKFRPGR